MMTSVSDAISAGKFSPDSPANLARLAQIEDDAAAYLRSRWPGAELADVRGGSFFDVLRVRDEEAACANCPGEDACPVRGHPKALVEEAARGRHIYRIYLVPCPKRQPSAGEAKKFERLFNYSGLSEKQREQNFDAFNPQGLGPTVVKAKSIAMLAAKEGLWLALAGSRGVGKSHLAAAIALEVMRNGKQAYFRMISELLDDLRAANIKDDGAYYDKIAWLKTVDCLVLDDLGKERSTAAGMEYLHQIVDARYREKRQTIVTTNALTREELIGWGVSDYMAPLVSRLEEMGMWCSIRGEDYRAKIGKARGRANAKQTG